MKTEIIMIRHGQSIANAQSRFAGHSDFDLTELGHKQAELAAEYLYNSGQQVDKIYSSDLLRAHNTAVPFAKKYGLPINDTKDLREIFAGSWEAMTVDEIYEQYRDAFITWRTDFSRARCTDGESTVELYHRIVDTVKRIAQDNEGKTVLIATHATPIRAIDCFSHGWEAERIGDVSFVRNASISIFEYENGVITPKIIDAVDHLEPSQITVVPKNLDDVR
ncbi:MAG: histidine phosphatase family protein [Clostridia bacterium]|nr:histidine phosphatase family protein [Clostridia bacterium]